jgi:hypothetical protein
MAEMPVHALPRSVVTRAIAAAVLLLAPACFAPLSTYCMSRLDSPVDVVRAGLEDDLVVLRIHTSLAPAGIVRRAVAVPHGWEEAPAVPRDDGTLVLADLLPLRVAERFETKRQDLVEQRDIAQWPAEVRRQKALRIADDMPAGSRRHYRADSARLEDGRIAASLFGRVDLEPERLIATVVLPDDLTPPHLSGGVKALLYPPLTVVDAVLIGGGIAVLPIALPMMWLKSGPEPTE